MNEVKYRLEVEKWRDPNQAEASWDQNKCIIKNADGDTVFEYVRSYPNYSDSTFAPFTTMDGKDFALISSDYTRVDVVDLEKGEVIGRTPTYNPFCPVQIYVPHINQWEMDWGKNFKEKYPDKEHRYELLWNYNDPDDDATDHLGNKLPIVATQFAFVAGCYWGDDSSWKIQLIDLRDMTQPNYYEAFGYISMPRNVTKLSDLVGVDIWGNEKDPTRLFQVEVNGIPFRFNEDWSLKECYYEVPPTGKTPEQYIKERKEQLAKLKMEQQQ